MVTGDFGGDGIGADGIGYVVSAGTFAGSSSFAGELVRASGAGEFAAGGEEAAGKGESGISSAIALALRKRQVIKLALIRW